MYFADDDHTYDLELFEVMRTTKKVAVWPVGRLGEEQDVERPLADDNGTVTGWNWNAKFAPVVPCALDAAGFAVNLRNVLENKHAWFDARFGFAFQVGERRLC